MNKGLKKAVFDKLQGENGTLKGKITHLENVITFYQEQYGKWEIGYPSCDGQYEVMTSDSKNPFKATFYAGLFRWITAVSLENGDTTRVQTHPIAWRQLMREAKRE